MASWIKMRVDLKDDPAVISIAARLDQCEDTIVGKLHTVWSWFDQQTTSGNAAGVTRAWLDRRVNCPGFAEAMTAVGWLVATETGLQLPKFDTHNGETGKARALTAKRVANSKARQTSDPARTNADTVTTGNASGNARTVTSALPRIEKEKSKNRRDSSSESLQRPSSSSTPAPATVPATASGWEEVEEGLKRLKVSLIRKAVDSAREHEFNPPQVMALIGYLETNPPGCVSAKGAIFNRLVEQAADAVHWDATEHWPWSDSSGSAPGTNGGAAGYPVQPTSAEARDRELAESRRRSVENDRLIVAHASTLAALDDQALDAVIGEAPEKSQPELRRQVKAKGRDSPLVHLTLLGLLDRRTGPPAES